MSELLKWKASWPYDGNLNELQDLLLKWMEYDYITLQMTQAQYDLFYNDVDANTLAASRFRPLDLETNECKPKWLFNGKLKLYIKIKT